MAQPPVPQATPFHSLQLAAEAHSRIGAVDAETPNSETPDAAASQRLVGLPPNPPQPPKRKRGRK